MYTLQVGPHISDGDPTSAEMDQNMNLTYGEPFVSTSTPGDAFVAVYDIDGLRVVPPVTPSSPLPLPVGLSSVTVTFNEAVSAATFNANNVSVTGPRGVVPLLNLTDLTLGTTNTHTQWKVAFVSALTAYGTYTLTISPGVQDLAGNAMNQNANEFYGEATDGYQTSFQIGGLEVLASQVTPVTTQPVLTPAGLSSITLPFNMTVQPATFTTADITLRRPDGSTVSPIMLTDKTVATTGLHNLWELDFAPQTVPGVYTLTVGPNLDDIGSHLMDQDQNGIFGDSGDAFVAKFSVDGLAVTNATPPVPPLTLVSLGANSTTATAVTATPHGLNNGDQVTITGANEAGYDGTFTVSVIDPLTFTYTVPASTPATATGNVSAMKLTEPGLTDETITFNQGVQPGSLNANTVTLTGPAGAVPLLAFTDVTAGSPNLHNVWDVRFGALTTPGLYALTVGPGAKDLAGNTMNQNHNGTFGEATDAFQTTFVVDGLHVTSVTPSLAAPVPTSPGLSSVSVTFNRSVDPTTFDATDLKLLTPDNQVVTGLSLTDITSTVPFAPPASVWQINFPTQTRGGVYTLVIGPHISDVDPLKVEMDQNENQVYGEAFLSATRPGDAFVAQFNVGGLQVVSTTPPNGASLPLGTSSVDVQFNQGVLASTMTNPANFTLTASYPVATITNNGTLARVTTVSPTGLNTGDQVTILGANETAYDGTFIVAVTGPNTFTYTLQSAAPSPATGTITVSPVKTIAVTGARDLTLGTSRPTHDLWEVDFPPLATYGTYSLTLGTGIEDMAGNPLNQNGDAVYGEPGVAPFGDEYQTSFHVNGLQVVSVAPDAATPQLGSQGLSSATVTFNQGIDSTTFDSTDLTLTAPDGTTVPVSTVKDISATTPNAVAGTVWQVTFPKQQTPGVYALTIGPDINDLGGHPMDQNLNAIPGEVPADQFTARFDVDGLAVLPQGITVNGPSGPTPAGPTPLQPGQSSVTITFNQAVLASSMVPGDFTLNGPAGSVPVNQVVDLNPGTDTIWEVDFFPQNLPGTYTLLLGTGIEDLAGNALNQNDNSIPGESGLAPLGDQVQATFVIGGLEVVPPLVSPPLDHPISPATGLSSVTITFNRAVDATTFAVSDLGVKKPDGSTLPAASLRLTDLNPGTDTRWQVQFPTQTTAGVYTITVGPHIADTTGTEMDQNQNQKYGEAGDAFVGKFDVAGLQVTSVLPVVAGAATVGTVVPSGLSEVQVTFNQAVLQGSLGANTVTILGPTNVSVPIVRFDFNQRTPNVVGVFFSPLTAYGTYTVQIGPGVQDLAGNPMNQNGDGTFGDAGFTVAGSATTGGDGYQTSFALDGLRVTGAFPPPGVSLGGLSSITLTFNMGVLPTTFLPSDVVLTAPDGSNIPVAVTDATPAGAVAHTQWLVTFAPQAGQGTYSLALLPNLLDAAGNLMDQNHNHAYGEAAPFPGGDEFTALFVVGTPSVTPGGGTIPGTTGVGTDVTGQVQMVASKIKRKGKTKFFRQTLRLTNFSGHTLQGPFTVVVDGLPRKVKLFSASGFTGTAHGASGHPFQAFAFPGGVWSAGQGDTITLVYFNPAGKKIRPIIRVFAGTSNP
jgi:hypothetical protein